jgi:hypothetical protein
MIQFLDHMKLEMRQQGAVSLVYKVRVFSNVIVTDEVIKHELS